MTDADRGENGERDSAAATHEDIQLLLDCQNIGDPIAGQDENKENGQSQSSQAEPPTPGQVSNISAANSEHGDTSIYEFMEERSGTTETPTASTVNISDISQETQPRSSRKAVNSSSKKEILRAKIHKVRTNEYPIDYVEVGEKFKSYFHTHPAIRGIYLNKGKREVKRHLVELSRANSAIDKGSWQRGKHVHERNRLDDRFELTEDGKKKRDMILKRMYRDEYAVNWYLFCPGRGNCRRKCGGYGECVKGCKGMSHKQDRHNCSLMVNLKLFLSDLGRWRVHITGCHVPVEAACPWIPPPPTTERINEDVRDIILSASQKQASPSQIQQIVSVRIAPDMCANARVSPPSKRRIGRLVSSMKKRRKDKDYNIKENEPISSKTGESAEVEIAAVPEDESGTCVVISENDAVSSSSQFIQIASPPLINVANPCGSHHTHYNDSVGVQFTPGNVCGHATNQMACNAGMVQTHAPAMSHDQIQPMVQTVTNMAHHSPVIMYEIPDQVGNTYYYSPTVMANRLSLQPGTVTISQPGGATMQPAQSTPVLFPQTPSVEILEVSGGNTSVTALSDIHVSNLGPGDINALYLAASQQQQHS